MDVKKSVLVLLILIMSLLLQVASDSENLTVGLGFLGLYPDPNYNYTKNTKIPSGANDTIAPEMDARKQWPDCANLIGYVRDQGLCGASWAFSSVEVLTDRYCIWSHTNITLYAFSPEDLLFCCNFCGYGCEGGYPVAAWEYFIERGVVTGKDEKEHNGDLDGCKLYSKKTAKNARHSAPCVRLCRKEHMVKNRFPDVVSYYQDKHSADNVYRVDPSTIQLELQLYGPVQASFTIYKDFIHYKSGVYVCKGKKELLGKHMVKIIGWGSENSVPYWLAVNSWGTRWGDKGLFKIKRGSNECEIEKEVIAGSPKLFEKGNRSSWNARHEDNW